MHITAFSLLIRKKCIVLNTVWFVLSNVQLARPNPSGELQVAPVTGNDVGLRRAEVKQGVREVVVCKDQDGKIGLRVRDVNKVLKFMVLCVINNNRC